MKKGRQELPESTFQRPQPCLRANKLTEHTWVVEITGVGQRGFWRPKGTRCRPRASLLPSTGESRLLKSLCLGFLVRNLGRVNAGSLFPGE